MKIFVVGTTGVIGQRLVPLLVGRGYQVVATTRYRGKAEELRRWAAEPVVIDLLDRECVMRAVTAAQPAVIIHQATALTGFTDLKRFDAGFALTNRLRTEGLDHLLAAARAAGTRRVLAQSFTGWPNVREGDPVKSEADPLDPNPPAAMRRSLAAIRYLEETLRGATEVEGLALRYGTLYGPGTALSEDGAYPEMIRKRHFPIIGNGAGVWSFVHIDDAVAATVAAVERGDPGVYNIVDDDPAPVREWLPYLADVLGAKPPRQVPVWLGRLLVGDVGVSMMTQIRGSLNIKAKCELNWQPRYPSWRQGFRAGLSQSVASYRGEPVRG